MPCVNHPSIKRRSGRFNVSLLAAAVLIAAGGPALAADPTPADLNDLEIAHVAYTAGSIDIRYAHLALAISDNPAVRNFAETMIRDHTTVNDQALALVKALKISPKDNFMSRSLLEGSRKTLDELRRLEGVEFDRRYAANELGYHRAVNGAVGDVFIPNAKTPKLKALLQSALKTFKIHQAHAEQMVADLKQPGSK